MRVDPEPSLTRPGTGHRTVEVLANVREDDRVSESLEMTRPPLARPAHGRMVAGVCAGVGRHLGVPLHVLRVLAAIAVLTGPGLPVYAFLWLTMPRSDASAPEPTVNRFDLTARQTAVAGIVMLVFGGLFVARTLRSNVSLGIILPAAAIVGGVVLVWSRLDVDERREWLRGEVADRRSLLRYAAGAVLVIGGLVLLISQGRGLGGLRDVALSTVVLLVGAGVIVAPFALRLWDSMRREQAERILATQKADIAAHLHDSVLQTLALIQRRSDDAQGVQLLARAQERELREWLYAEDRAKDRTLATLVKETVAEVEELHGIPIDLVVSGDRPVDDGGRALLGALREATANAVRHGEPPVSVYVEVTPGQVEAFVRDHGGGFDLDDVPGDRLGVRESILGRMERHGGHATIRRRDDGTEVSLELASGRSKE